MRIRIGVTGSLDAAGNWTGVYFNRNSLAPVAVLGLMMCLVLLAIGRRELRADAPGAASGRRRTAVLAAGAGVAAVVVWLYCVGLNTVETFAVGNSLYWALLAGGVAAGRAWGGRPFAVRTTSGAQHVGGEDEVTRRYGARGVHPELVRRH